ncbi:MAG: ATP-binding cassette domain-containing protein, partial [Alphaproteobacteria bacterium]|nr:ATP-binding cassette domain-containing protein [Alphaproteobacteria bacterium]
LGLAAATRFYAVTWLGERVVADIRKSVFDNVLGLSPQFFEVTRTGEVLSRMTADTTLIQTVVGSSASMALRNLVTLTGGLALMFFTSVKLTLLVVGAVVVVMLPLLLFGRWVRKLSRASQDSIADTAARGAETLNAVPTVQAFTQENYERRAFGDAVERAFVFAKSRTLARAILTAIAIFTAFAGLATVGLIGLHDFIGGHISAGQLVAFIFYGILTGGGVGALSEVWGDLQRAAGASERLMELLHEVPAIRPPAHPLQLPPKPSGGVRFENITFRYPTRPDFKALNGFSLDVAGGEAVALVGPSGAGKSTVFQLMLRFFDAQAGSIRFDGVDITQLDPVALRQKIAVVSQEPVIFSGSIAANIRYGREHASDEQVRAAADAAAASEFIEKLPHGFDTLVGERGVTLSGRAGQSDGGPHHFGDRAPFLHHSAAQAHCGDGRGQGGGARQPCRADGRRRALCPAGVAAICGCYAMRLGRPRRIGRALAMLGIVVLVSATARAVWSNGVFSSVPTGFLGSCKVAGAVPGVQDMEAANGMAFISVASARGPSVGDGIYAMPLAGGALRKLAGAPRDFHPRGIGLYRTPDGKGLFLMAVNRRSGGASARAGATNNNGRFSIDSFEVTDPAGTPALVAQGTVEGGMLINPQDVAVASPGSFYVANGTAGKNPLLHIPQTYGVIPGGNVLFFNGMTFKEVADGLYGTRSLILTGGGTHLVVGGLLSRSLTSFSREPFTGALTETGTLLVGAGPERLSLDGQGQLWVGGHANLMDWRAFNADPSKRAPSQLFRVSLVNGVPQEATQVYGNDGGELAGASVGIAAGNRLLIGSSLDTKLLDCQMN